MKINDVDFTPQELECVRIALDAYEAEMDGNADSLEPVHETHEFERAAVHGYRAEATVARTTREKWREVTR